LIYKSQAFKRAYKSQVEQELSTIQQGDKSILTLEDIEQLPQPVQKYILYTGVVGKEKVQNLRIVCSGEFRPDPQKGWVPMNSEQYNFFGNPSRYYYMKLKMSGLPVAGLHSYRNAQAVMQIKIASLFTVADAKGDIMNKSETVTVFNEMCLAAPATLIDKRISWQTIDPLTVKASFSNNGVTITAMLYFNDKGEIINFTSEDRSMSADGKTYRQGKWSTPIRDYKDFNGVKLASYGEAIWNFPEGDYCYGKLNIQDIKYNCSTFIQQF
jgi:hypothetical protein